MRRAHLKLSFYSDDDSLMSTMELVGSQSARVSFDYSYVIAEAFLPRDLLGDAPLYLELNPDARFLLSLEPSAGGAFARAKISSRSFVGLEAISTAALSIQTIGKRVSLGIIESPRLTIEFFDASAERRIIKELLFFDQSSAREIDFNYEYARVTFRSLSKIDSCSLRLGLKQTHYNLNAADSDKTAYKSGYIEHKSFLWAMHFGSYDLNLLADHSVLPMGKLNRKNIIGLSGKKSRKMFANMVDEICKLPITNVFEAFSNARPSNAPLQTLSNFGTQLPLVTLHLARKLARELEELLASGEKLASRLVERQRYGPYNAATRFDGESLKNLTNNQRFLMASAHGRPASNIAPHEIGAVHASYRAESHSIPENLAIVDVGLAIASALNSFAIQFEASSAIFSETEKRLVDSLQAICARHGLAMSLSNVDLSASATLALRGRQSLLDTLNQWLRQGLPAQDQDFDMVNQISMPNIDDLWELFCLQQILKALEAESFRYDRTVIRPVSSKAEICLSRPGEIAKVLYEPALLPTEQIAGVVNTNKSKKYTPDFLIQIIRSGGSKIGIIDAKFSIDPTDHVGRGNEIWGKYGAWIVQETGEALDYIHAMVPVEGTASFDSQRISGFNLMDLGILSAPPQPDPDFLEILGETML